VDSTHELWKRLARIGQNMGVCLPDAEEMAGLVLQRLREKGQELEPPYQAIRAMKNRVLDYFRRQQSRQAREGAYGWINTDFEQYANPERRLMTRLTVQEAIDKLPEDERDLARWLLLEEDTYAEVSARLGTTISRVQRQLHQLIIPKLIRLLA
jgi:RNA polymerase sigma factor (sigma-70 family)